MEYARFTERRALWKELGMTPDTTHAEWQEAATFLRLEHAHEKKDK